MYTLAEELPYFHSLQSKLQVESLRGVWRVVDTHTRMHTRAAVVSFTYLNPCELLLHRNHMSTCDTDDETHVLVRGMRFHRLTVIIDMRIDLGWIGWQMRMSVGSHVSGSDVYAFIYWFAWLHSVLCITPDFSDSSCNLKIRRSLYNSWMGLVCILRKVFVGWLSVKAWI